MRSMRLYFDCCCYNRPFDDLSQDRIHDESEAVLSLLNRCRKSTVDAIIGSEILCLEIDEIRDPRKRAKVRALVGEDIECVPYSEQIQKRAEGFQRESHIHEMDSLHLASAEAAAADIFLTTDDKLLHACQKIDLSVRVMNPVVYLGEVIGNDEH